VVTFGQTFASGEIPTGQSILATAGSTPLNTQVDVKRRNADGSVRHAVISVQLPARSVAAGSQASISFGLAATSSAPTGSPVALPSVNAAGSPIDYRVEIIEHGLKADGSATDESGRTWTTTLKSALAGTTSSWLSGPLVSEWRARVAPTSGVASHPGLRVIFDARYQSTTQGRLSVAIENVESSGARGNRTYDLRIYNATTGGTAVYSVDNVLHPAATRMRKLIYLGAGSKELIAIADSVRLKSSRAIPNYADLAAKPELVGSVYDLYNRDWPRSYLGLFNSGIITGRMPNSGGRWDIGPLPGWVALAMISQDPRAYKVMLDTAERASYWGIHYRDSAATVTAADILSIDTYPNISLDSRNTGTAPTQLTSTVLPVTEPTNPDGGVLEADSGHEPSLAYAPYLVTGDRYYLDELYFWANYNMLYPQGGLRDFSQGLFSYDQLRGQAWSMRTLGHAAFLAPDGDWRQTYFIDKLNSNLANYRATVSTSNTVGFWNTWAENNNPAGIPEFSTQVCHILAPWQHSFMAFTMQQITDWGFSGAIPLRNFSQGFTVKMFTSEPAYRALDGAAYQIATTIKNGGSCASPTVLSTMADIYSYTFANRTLLPTQVGDYNSPDGGAATALATLGQAIDAGVTNSSTGYVFLRTELMKNGTRELTSFVQDPTWNIVPRGSVSGLSEAPGVYTR